MSEDALFEKYIKRIQEKYEISDIRSSKWYYSLSATPLNINSVVICGFNWGVNEPHEPQQKCPIIDFMDNNDLGSLQRIKGFLKQYLSNEDLSKIVQINLCFFRSRKEKDITQKDFEMNKEIFISLVKDLRPKMLIALSSKIYEVLKPFIVFESVKSLKNGNRTISLIKATLNEEFGKGNLAYVPHPNYPLTSQARIEAWKYALSDNKLRE